MPFVSKKLVHICHGSKKIGRRRRDAPVLVRQNQYKDITAAPILGADGKQSLYLKPGDLDRNAANQQISKIWFILSQLSRILLFVIWLRITGFLSHY